MSGLAEKGTGGICCLFFQVFFFFLELRKAVNHCVTLPRGMCVIPGYKDTAVEVLLEVLSYAPLISFHLSFFFSLTIFRLFLKWLFYTDLLYRGSLSTKSFILLYLIE